MRRAGARRPGPVSLAGRPTRLSHCGGVSRAVLAAAVLRRSSPSSSAWWRSAALKKHPSFTAGPRMVRAGDGDHHDPIYAISIAVVLIGDIDIVTRRRR